MTIEQLIECDASTLEKMTDTELLKHFEKYLNVTRPERQPKQVNKAQQMLTANPKLAQGLALAASLGIEVPSIATLTIKRRK